MANALFNDNKMKLGVFGPNVSHGCAATTAEGHFVLNWQNSRDIVETADRIGLEALVPVARWKGFGGPTNFNGATYESLTWAAAMGAISKSSTIFPRRTFRPCIRSRRRNNASPRIMPRTAASR